MSDDLLIHIGHGDGRKTYMYGPKKMLNVEYIAIEQATGLKGVEEIGEALRDVSMALVTALVWVLRKRDEPRLQLDEVVFPLGDLTFEDPDKNEVAAAPKAAKKAARKP